MLCKVTRFSTYYSVSFFYRFSHHIVTFSVAVFSFRVIWEMLNDVYNAVLEVKY